VRLQYNANDDAARYGLPWYRQRTVGQAITIAVRDRAERRQQDS
jgi:hypothetical protein